MQQAEIVGDAEASAGLVPAGAVQDDDGMRARSDVAADLGEMQVHRLGIDLGQNQAGADAARRTNRAEDVGPIVALIARRSGPAAALGPDIGQAALLSDPGFVQPPELDRLAVGRGWDEIADQ